MKSNNHEGASTSITMGDANNLIEMVENQNNDAEGTLDTSNTVQEPAQFNEGAPPPATNNGVSTGSDSEPCIFKVHNQLRNVHKRDYDPQIIAIGPYHRGKSEHFKLMEAHKLRFQKLLLQRKNQQLPTYVDAINPDYERALKCYAEPTTGLSQDDFVGMLVLDGMFIIELLLKFKKFKKFKSDREIIGPIDEEGNDIRNDPVFRMPWALTLLQRDLMLFENQLPFFILVKLYEMIAPPGELAKFEDLALCFFNDIFPGVGKKRGNSNTNTEAVQDKDIKHLLDLIHMNWGSQKVSDKNDYTMDNIELIECSTSLRETGVHFEKIDDGGACFDVELKNGVLRIPVFTIEGRTESFLRNLIAFEQYSGDSRFQIVTDYMIFICCLIKSEKDFARLTRHGILRKFIINDEDASRMFKTMSECITGPSVNFHYGDIFQRVNEHYRNNHNSIGTMIRRKYMNSAWGMISIFSATLLLALAVLEVVFQILSWHEAKKTD